MKLQVHKLLEERHLGWSPDIVDSSGKDFINAFTEALWCIDGHEKRLASQPEKSKHRRKDVANLSCDILDHHVSTLNHFLIQPWMRSVRWMSVREMMAQFSASLSNYATYLKRKIAEMKGNHSMSQPVRNIANSASYTSVEAAMWVRPSLARKYKPLDAFLRTQQCYSPAFVNDFAPADARYFLYQLSIL